MKQKNTVWEWMKNAIATVKTIMGIIPKNVKVAAARSLEVTTGIKKVLDNPVVDVLTAIIPGDWDNAAVQLMRSYLQRAMQYLAIVDNCSHITDVNEMLQCWVAQLQKLHPDAQNALLHKLAALLTAYQDNEALRQRLYDLYVQLVYVDRKS